MTWRKPLIAFIVFAVFVGLYCGDRWWIGQRKAAKELRERAFPVKEDDIVEMSLITPDEIITVKKKDKEAKVTEARWTMTQPLETRADADEIQVILGNLLPATRYGEFKVDSTIKLDDYGLDEPTYTMKVTTKDAKSYTLLVGKQAPESGKFYAKLENENKIFSINEYIKDKLDKKPFDLRDRTVLHVSVDDVKRVAMTRAIQMPVEIKSTSEEGTTQTTSGYERKAPEQIVITKADNGQWKLEKPVEWKGDDIEIENLLRKLKTEKVTKFFDKPSTKPVDYGFDHPQIRLRIEQLAKTTEKPTSPTKTAATSPTETLLLVVGNRSTTGTKKTYYAKRGEGPVVTIGSELFDALAIKATKLRDKKMFTLAEEDIAHVEFVARRGTSKVRLDKTDKGRWVFTDDKATSVDQDIIRDKIGTIANLRAKDFETDQPGDLAQYKLDKPFVRVTIWDKDGKTTEGISIGDLATREGKSVVFAQRLGQKSVVLLDFTKPMQLAMTKNSLIDKSLFTFNYADVTRAEVTKGSTTFTLTREDNTWKILRAGDEKPQKVSAFTAEDVPRTISKLKYKLLYKGNLTEEEMGLTSPTLVVVLYGKGGAEIARVIRGIEKGERYYTKIKPGGPVYGIETSRFATLDSAIDELLKKNE